MNKREILKFIKASIKWLEKNDRGCYQYYLDDDLSIFIGWSQTRLLEEPTLIHSIKNPEHIIAVGVKVRRSGDENDYDQLDFPWSHKDFCVTNFFLPAPEMTDAEYLKEIAALLNAYKETVEDHKKGVVEYDFHKFIRKE
jgi:hypothetical protein